MVWKLARLESMTDVGKREVVNEVKYNANVKVKPMAAKEKPPTSATTSTPKRLYARNPPNAVRLRRVKNDPSLEDKGSTQKVQGRSIRGGTPLSKPSTSNINNPMQHVRDTLQKTNEGNNFYPSLTSFRIGLHSLVCVIY